MHPTVEVRWFVHGSLPDDTIAWYENAVGRVSWNERTDRYVRPVAPDGLNVKWREGYIEVKRKVEDIGEVGWETATGRIERWRKWSFPVAERGPIPASGQDWMIISKRRTKRRVSPREGKLVRLRSDERVPDGCTIEIAEVGHQHDQWWTFSLEAFGSDAEARLILQRVGEQVFAEPGAPTLSTEDSMSYVRWLFARAAAM